MASLSASLPDTQSRNTLRDFGVQTMVGVVLMLAIFVLKMQTIFELAQAAAQVFTFYCVIDCARALSRRERVWEISLNYWDRAAAYFLIVMLLNLLLDATP